MCQDFGVRKCNLTESWGYGGAGHRPEQSSLQRRPGNHHGAFARSPSSSCLLPSSKVSRFAKFPGFFMPSFVATLGHASLTDTVGSLLEVLRHEVEEIQKPSYDTKHFQFAYKVVCTDFVCRCVCDMYVFTTFIGLIHSYIKARFTHLLLCVTPVGGFTIPER